MQVLASFESLVFLFDNDAFGEQIDAVSVEGSGARCETPELRPSSTQKADERTGMDKTVPVEVLTGCEAQATLVAAVGFLVFVQVQVVQQMIPKGRVTRSQGGCTLSTV